MEAGKRIALVAHDAKKSELIDWVKSNVEALQDHQLWATGSTGGKIQEACPELKVVPLKSGPLGGDQQIGARIAEGALDILIFFTDGLSPLPHDADVRALTRLSTLYNVAMATNRTTADFLIASPLFAAPYSAPTGGGDGEPGTEGHGG
jgi:methylglyoxal synthase